MTPRATMQSELKLFLIDDLLIEVPAAEIKPDAGLASELGVDSLGFTELMAHIEDRYGIAVSDAEFVPENFRCLDTVMDLVHRKQKAAA